MALLEIVQLTSCKLRLYSLVSTSIDIYIFNLLRVMMAPSPGFLPPYDQVTWSNQRCSGENMHSFLESRVGISQHITDQEWNDFSSRFHCRHFAAMFLNLSPL